MGYDLSKWLALPLQCAERQRCKNQKQLGKENPAGFHAVCDYTNKVYGTCCLELFQSQYSHKIEQAQARIVAESWIEKLLVYRIGVAFGFESLYNVFM